MSSTTVVLGGGGLAGIGWLTGVLAALEETGALTLADADTVIGTSAGSAVGAAVLQSGSAVTQFDVMVRATRRNTELSPSSDLAAVMTGIVAINESDADAADKARQLVELSRRYSRTDPAARRAVVASRLPSQQWPENLQVTALRADGELVAFTSGTGVGIVDAVAASCAVPRVWPAVHVDDADYIDGGSLSATNAHLAADADRVIVLAPMADLGGAPAPEVAAVLDRATVIRPSERAAAGFGPNPLDPDIRGVAAVLGYEDGYAVATTGDLR